MSSAAILFLFAALKLAVHLACGEGYGYFRDELYYLACADHLDLGYVDHPPFSIFVLWVVRALFGDSILTLRVTAALVGVLAVVLTGLLARVLGGGRLAEALAMAGVLIAPIVLGVDSFYSMNAIEIALWPAAALAAAHAIGGEEARAGESDRSVGSDRSVRSEARASDPSDRSDPTDRADFGARFWLLLGVLIGIGLLNKISMSWLAGGLALGIFFSERRAMLVTRGPWLAAATAAALFAPHLLWQVAHGWPTLEFMRNASAEKMVAISPLEFAANQVLVTSPFTLPLQVAGLVFYFAARKGRRFRPLGWAFVATAGLLVSAGTSRANYLAPAYPMLFAGGAVAIEHAAGRRRWIGFTLLALMLLGGIATAPLALPLLAPESYGAYAAALGVAPPVEEKQAQAALPQHLADRHGWVEVADTVAAVFARLPTEERGKAGIFAGNYGEAGAIDHLGPPRGLPAAVSGHNSYWLWGPRRYTGEVMVVFGVPRERLDELFGRVEEMARIRCRFCMPFETDNPVYVCRDPVRPLPEMWERAKFYR